MTMTIDFKGDMYKLSLTPDDILVLKMDVFPPATNMKVISDTLKEHFPNNRVLIFDKGIDFEVLTMKQIFEMIKEQQK